MWAGKLVLGFDLSLLVVRRSVEIGLVIQDGHLLVV